MHIVYPMYYFIPVVPTRMFDEEEETIETYEQTMRGQCEYNDLFYEIDEEYVKSNV